MSDEWVESITLGDIEKMIKILERYLRTARKVESILSRFGRTSRPEIEIAKMLIGMRESLPGYYTHDEDVMELTEEEKKVIEKIRSKFSEKQSTQS